MEPTYIYFGCWDKHDSYGYGFHGPGRKHLQGKFPEGWPWGYEVDGGLQPHEPQRHIQGHCKMNHKDGWTCLAWWDMTADSRPASCSAVAVDRDANLAEMLGILRNQFPEVLARQTEPLHEFV